MIEMEAQPMLNTEQESEVPQVGFGYGSVLQTLPLPKVGREVVSE